MRFADSNGFMDNILMNLQFSTNPKSQLLTRSPYKIVCCVLLMFPYSLHYKYSCDAVY